MKQIVEKSEALLVYEALYGRMPFGQVEKNTFARLVRGYQGERVWSEMAAKKLSSSFSPLYDLTFLVDGNEVQIDSLILTQSTIYHLEIKNYSGDYVYGADQWTLNHGATLLNPLNQLRRAHALLKKELRQLQLDLSLESYLIFVNPSFNLFQSRKDLPIILPNMMTSFLKKIQSDKPLPFGAVHRAFLQRQVTSKHQLKPSYTYEALRKGIFCKKCAVAMRVVTHKSFACLRCRARMTKSRALAEAVRDFILLFPEEKLTKTIIAHWTNHLLNESTVRNYLKEAYELVDQNRGSFYMK